MSPFDSDAVISGKNFAIAQFEKRVADLTTQLSYRVMRR
jgi:hypothetical protein